MSYERIPDISIEDSRVFMKCVCEVLGESGLKEIKGCTYWYKLDILEDNYKQILNKLKEWDEYISERFILNKKSFFTDVVCRCQDLYNELSWEQKLIVLTQMYHIHPKGAEDKTWLTSEEFIKELDKGNIENYVVSAGGYSDKTEALLDYKVNSSDILFWLQNEWKDLSGDFFTRKYYGGFSRGTKVFTNKQYQAFNEVFKHVFGRELQCIDKYKESNSTSVINKFKGILDL